MILGTAAYMAPEQARGQVSISAPISGLSAWWSMIVTGRRLFEAPTVSDTLAAVLTRDRTLSAPPGCDACCGGAWSATPATAARYQRRAPSARRRRAGPIRRRRLLAWLWPALAAVGLFAAAALAFVHYREAPSDLPLVRFQISLPEKAVFNGHVSVSPDGRRVAFSARGADGRRSSGFTTSTSSIATARRHRQRR